MKRVLIACECSGAVRDAFTARGFYAVSCDIKETEAPGLHHKGDVFEIINDGWDLMIAHPPCNHLAASGAKHFADKIKDGRQQAALDFVLRLMNANIPRIAIENPVGIIGSKIRKADQIIQPWMFGHSAVKTTCLWLKFLPNLVPTNIVEKGGFKVWYCEKTKRIRKQSLWDYEISKVKGKARVTARSRTFQGIADAMADQWGAVL